MYGIKRKAQQSEAGQNKNTLHLPNITPPKDKTAATPDIKTNGSVTDQF
jgi:hypothetical protein